MNAPAISGPARRGERESFVPGVLLAVPRAASLSEPLVVGLESLLS